MLVVLRQRNYLLLWLAGLISMTGDWVLFTALPIYVYTLTGSPLATSATFAAELVPALLLGSVAGVYVDRWPRKRIMVASNILLGLTLLPLLLVRSADLVWIVYPVAFVQSVLAQFFNPAEQAVLPTLVGEEMLVTANSLASLNRNVARLIGPPLGGVIAVSMGLAGVTLIDTASFLSAAVLVYLIVMPKRTPAPSSSGPDVSAATPPGADEPVTDERSSDAAPGSPRVWREWLDGLQLVRSSHALTVLIGIFTITSLGEGVFGTMFVVWVKSVLHGSALQFGWFMSAQAVGGILGGLVIGAIGSRIVSNRLAWAGFLLFALLDITLFNYPRVSPQIWIGLVVMVLVGIPAAGGSSGYMTLLQTAIPDVYRGRVFGALGTTSALTQLIGTAIAGTLGSIVGPMALLTLFQGGGYILASLLLLAESGRLALILARRGEPMLSPEV